MDMTTKTQKRGGFRINSIFLKLAGVIFVMSAMLTAMLAVLYTGAAIHELEDVLKHSGGEITEMTGETLAGAIAFGDAEDIGQHIGGLTQHEASETVHGLAVKVDGSVIVAEGVDPTLEGPLAALAMQAIESGERVNSADGFQVATPVFYGDRDGPVGAFALAWTAEHIVEGARATQKRVVMIAAAVVLVGIVLMMIGIRAWVTKPLAGVSRMVDEVARENYDIDIKTATRGDELGDLGKSVDKLRSTLQSGAAMARENRFRGKAFESSSAAIMMASVSL